MFLTTIAALTACAIACPPENQSPDPNPQVQPQAEPVIAATASEVEPAMGAVSEPAPRIEVAFVLDTTGSMGGLIEGAKLKIWSIANEIISAKPTPNVKLGLIGYRDRGDEYVTRVFELTDDIDAIYQHLRAFQAGGGGDGPESVNQALHEAVTRMSWSDDRDVLKIIFLVGDAPPHMDYQDDVKYSDVCQAAMKRELIINTVQCGSMAETTPIWQDIARLSEGAFVAIGQSGDMVAVATPVDAELVALNSEIGQTLVAWGTREERDFVASKQAAAEAAAPAACSDRLAFNAASGKIVQGRGDLIDDIAAGRCKLEDVKADELPEAMRSMTIEQRQAYVTEQAAKRAEIQKKINELLAKRQAFIEAALKKHKDSFDQKVAETIRSQAERKRIKDGC
jgi:Mg-chelatase subunit ChlD